MQFVFPPLQVVITVQVTELETLVQHPPETTKHKLSAMI